MRIWIFSKIIVENAREQVYDSVKQGASRMGWSPSNRSEIEWKNDHPAFDIQPGDWIVQLGLSSEGLAVAALSTGAIFFDEGIECEWGRDFRLAIPVDVERLLEFDVGSILGQISGEKFTKVESGSGVFDVIEKGLDAMSGNRKNEVVECGIRLHLT